MMAEPLASTAVSLLEAAERTTQSIGYNGLSFRDLAAAVGIKSASVHYHFPTKGLLGAAVARRYTDRLVEHLGKVGGLGGKPEDALAAYVAVFRTTLEQDGRMCLCGMLAAEVDAVPQEVRAEVRRFVELNVRWISCVLERTTSAPDASRDIKERATALFAALEGAMLVARGTGDITTFDAITAQFRHIGLLPAKRDG